MANKFRLQSEGIVPGLAPEDDCMTTDRILVDGSPVGYMYRDGSGWVFTAGDETPGYLAERHVNLLSLNEIANYDRAILPYLQAPAGGCVHPTRRRLRGGSRGRAARAG